MGNNFQEIEESKIKSNGVYWICTFVNDLRDICEKFSIREDNIIDCEKFNKATKIEYYSSYIFVIFNILEYYNEGVHSRELYIFLSKNFIITAFKEKLDLLEDLLSDISSYKNCSMLKEKPHPTIMFYYILDRIILKNYSAISLMGEEGDKIEIRILKNPKHEILYELIHLRRELYKLRKYLNPLRYIGDTLKSNDNGVIEENYIKIFEILNEKINKLMLSLESLSMDMALAREAYEAEIANKTNELMKIFTTIATVFLPLNLITSIYGMNIKHMPFSEYKYTYYIIVITMFIISYLLMKYFKGKKWL